MVCIVEQSTEMGGQSQIITGKCKHHTSNTHLSLVACTKSVRSSHNHVDGLYIIVQRRIYISVEATSWQPCCLQGIYACQLLRVPFCNSDLQPDKHEWSHTHSLVFLLVVQASVHLEPQRSTVQGVKCGVVAVHWLSIGGHGVNFEAICQLRDRIEYDRIRRRQLQSVADI